jgi:hypothetical protein
LVGAFLLLCDTVLPAILPLPHNSHTLLMDDIIAHKKQKTSCLFTEVKKAIKKGNKINFSPFFITLK